MTAAVSAEALRDRPVLLRGIRLGQVTEVVVDLEALRVVGFEVRCGDETDRFLPFPVAEIGESEIELTSALQLLDERDLGFYRRHTSALRMLRGLAVERRGRALGTLVDVVVAPDGTIGSVAVDRDGARVEVAVTEGVSIGGRRVASAA
ncbi:MAG TPA: PRC-barrel domain-containing protein [Gaiellaceae bacterium]|nr:PRC-barrel domain-containing protein [Gaiellaceae bacterium]